MPLISICIPCYQRVKFLTRLLDSVASQSFKDFEVIVTDDSPDGLVFNLCQQYKETFTISYFGNVVALGTPENWNEAVSRANGEWIKLMHDDDWFSSPDSLEIFAGHTNAGEKFIFSGYTRVFENKSIPPKEIVPHSSICKVVAKEPAILFADNLIGPPSVTLVHRSIGQKYDENLKWRVDIDFYVCLLEQGAKFSYINRSLINVGMSETQVTQSSINDPTVELPEGWVFLKKHGISSLKNIWIYDAWWRLLRNMNIKTEKQLLSYVNEDWPPVILKMTRDIGMIPSHFLKWGVTSKLCMGLSYLKNLSGIK